MYIFSTLLTCVLFFVSDSKGAISDTRLCGDLTCSEPVSYAKTLIRYASDDARILSFQANVKVTVFSKSAGSRPDLWGVEINGKRGYAPKDFIREYQVVKGKLEHVVPTSDNAPVINQLDGVSDKQDSQVDASPEKREESPPKLGDSKLNLPPFPNIGAAALEIKNDVVSSSETLEPYEVADGTTIYFRTEAPAEPVLIQATTTDSGIQTTMQSQLDPVSEKGNDDKPNPSIVLPQPTTSSEVNEEKEENEGSAEKIYQYLLSNFMPKQENNDMGSQEQESLDKEIKGEEVEHVTDSSEVGQKVFIESTESDSISLNTDGASKPVTSPTESYGTANVKVPLSTTAGIDTLEKLALSESLEDDEDEDDDEDLEDDEEYVDSEEHVEIYSGDSTTDSSQSGLSTDDKATSSIPAIQKLIDTSGLVGKKPEFGEPNSSIEVETKLEMHDHTEPGGASKMVQGNAPNPLDDESTKSDSDESLGQTSDHLSQSHMATDADLVGHDLSDTKMNSLSGTENSSSLESTNDSVLQPQDVGDGVYTLTEGETTSQLTDDQNPYSTHPLVMNTSDLEKTIDDQLSDQSITQEPEKNILDLSSEIVQERNTLSKETLSSHALPISSDGVDDSIHINSSVDEDVSNNTVTSQSVDKIADKPGIENTPLDNPQSNIMDNVKSVLPPDASLSEDDPVQTTVLPDIDSTETGYIDVLIEDSPLNVVTEIPALQTDDAAGSVIEDFSLDDTTDLPDTKIEDNTEAVIDDNLETYGGFFSNLFGSLFGGFASKSTLDDSETMEVSEESSITSETEDTPRNSVWSYTKPPAREANHQAETASSCLADSGSHPDCDTVLLAGNLPRVASDNNEEGTPHVMSEQEPNIPRMESGDYESSSEILSYLGITAVSMVVIILGHWFIEKMRCDSAYIKRINDLERALLYAELESKNLKIDMEECLQNKALPSEGLDLDQVARLEGERMALLERCNELHDANIVLEVKNNGLQCSLDEATQAGLDLNRMLSDLLASNQGSESLIGSVNDLQKQLNDQQTTISTMKVVLKHKEKEAEVLNQSMAASQTTIKSLGDELKVVTDTLNEFLEEKASLESEFKAIRIDLEAKLKLRSKNEEKLTEEISMLRGNIAEAESKLHTADVEFMVLRECITKLQADRKLENEDIECLFDVAKAQAVCRSLEQENKKLSDVLEEERGVRMLLEGHVEVVTSEVAMLRTTMEQIEKEKVEAVTKHAILADYFKDKETQLQKELGYRDALYMQTKGDATSTHEEVKSLNEEVTNLRAQIETLKKEIIDQERGFKTQIMAFEKKSQDNWVAARQTERTLQQTKQEAAVLRNRLLIVEKNASNSDKTATNEREMQETGIGSISSPPLPPNDMNVVLNDSNAGPYAAIAGLVNCSLSPIYPAVDDTQYLDRSNHASPANTSRSRLPVNPMAITFTLDEARDPNSPYFGILSSHAPYDPFYGKPIQDKNNPDVYHLLPLIPVTGPAPLILPPPILPNLNAHDRRPPPLGRMSSPPIMSPPTPRHAHMSPTYERSRRMTPPDRRMTPPERRLSPPNRRHRGHRYSSPHRLPRGGHSSRSPEREHRGSASPQEHGRRNSATTHHSTGQERTSSPEHGTPYRRRSHTPLGRYSDSSPDSGPDHRRYSGRRYDYSPESSYRSRTPSPTGFRPISREASNNQGSTRSSNHSFESDESSRRIGRP